MSGITSMIGKWIGELPVADVLKQRLELVKEQYESLEAEVAKLRDENSVLRHRVTELESSLRNVAVDAEFIELRGALFKKEPNGSFHDAVYCPRCKGPMSSLEGAVPYRCSQCKTMVDFTGDELNAVRKELVATRPDH